MTKLKHTLTNDLLFKMLFVKYPKLLEQLVSELLGIQHGSIERFNITNPEMPPQTLGDKFCRLDINMLVDGQRVNLEIQVENEGNYAERSLFMWARGYSTGISEGQDYALLPRTAIISILAFKQFLNPNKWHSEFQMLEVTTQEPLTDKCILHFYELPKLPRLESADRGKELWLKLFRAKTEEELARIDELGVPVMSEAIEAYRYVADSSEFKENERMRSKARHDEAQALRHAKLIGKREGADEEREKWQVVVDEKDSLIAELQAKIAIEQSGKPPMKI